jgi:medium-chain acyl-[acyl-carrier-protein] hydrolase
LYTTHERVSASRTNANGFLKLSSALDMIQDCSLFWMESEPSFHDYLLKNNLGMFLVSRQADILKLPEFGERVTVQTSIFDCKPYFGYRNSAIYGEDGRPCLVTWSVGAFVHRETGIMSRLPQEEIDRINMAKRLDMEYLNKKIQLPEAPGTRLAPVAVKRGDIDLNRHMNNVKYVETALELLPDDLHISRIRIEYKASAKLGGLLYPQYINTSDGKHFVILADSHDQPYTVMEFS